MAYKKMTYYQKQRRKQINAQIREIYNANKEKIDRAINKWREMPNAYVAATNYKQYKKIIIAEMKNKDLKQVKSATRSVFRTSLFMGDIYKENFLKGLKKDKQAAEKLRILSGKKYNRFDKQQLAYDKGNKLYYYQLDEGFKAGMAFDTSPKGGSAGFIKMDLYVKDIFTNRYLEINAWLKEYKERNFHTPKEHGQYLKALEYLTKLNKKKRRK